MSHDTQAEQPGALNPTEAAAWLSISLSQMYRLLRSGEVRGRRCGNRLLVPRKAIEEYLEADAAS